MDVAETVSKTASKKQGECESSESRGSSLTFVSISIHHSARPRAATRSIRSIKNVHPCIGECMLQSYIYDLVSYLSKLTPTSAIIDTSQTLLSSSAFVKRSLQMSLSIFFSCSLSIYCPVSSLVLLLLLSLRLIGVEHRRQLRQHRDQVLIG